MRMKTISETRTLRDVSNEFLAYKKARKVRERTLRDYQKYIDIFIEQSAMIDGFIKTIPSAPIPKCLSLNFLDISSGLSTFSVKQSM